MFQSPTCIKVSAVIALVLFVLVLLLGICITSASLLGAEYFFNNNGNTYGPISPEDPGAGWLVLFHTLGGTAAGMLSIFAAAIGLACILGSIIIYIPALIAWIVYKVSKNTTAYWILMGVWLIFCVIGAILAIFG